MKKITAYLISFMAIALFLVSSTGISYVIHHCSANHTEEIRLFTSDYQCSHEQSNLCCADKNEKAIHHECSFNKNHHCCKNTKGYFRIADDYTVNIYKTSITPWFSFISTTFLFTARLIETSFQIYNSNSPPASQSVQDFLSLLSQFRI